jgi:hypothetical protein
LIQYGLLQKNDVDIISVKKQTCVYQLIKVLKKTSIIGDFMGIIGSYWQISVCRLLIKQVAMELIPILSMAKGPPWIHVGF